MCGIDPARHDVRFEEDNWESPTLGAWGIGWQVLLDGMEITQFTYFQQAGGIELSPVSGGADPTGSSASRCTCRGSTTSTTSSGRRVVTYRTVRHQDEVEQTKYAFGMVDLPEAEFAARHRELFEQHHGCAGR